MQMPVTPRPQTSQPAHAGLSGVSVVICGHNAAIRLPATLACLACQEVSATLPWEVVIVDNASTDGTAAVAIRNWPEHGPAPLRVVSEPKLGLIHARYRGLQAAKYEYVSFVDDDNWVDPDWVANVARIMDGHPYAGACGGRSDPVFETPPPTWFAEYQRYYTCGEQAPSTGDVTWTRGHLWGAGLTLRKAAWQELLDQGFQPRLVGRQGNSLAAGEDVEICYALRLAGWRLWYDPRLRLRHYMPASRLRWEYLRRMHRGCGASIDLLDPYVFAAAGRSRRRSWQARAVRGASRLAHLLLKRPQLVAGWAGENDRLTLEWELALGRFTTLLSQRYRYEQGFADIARLQALIKASRDAESPENRRQALVLSPLP
jgi:glycosyltransferase involved in cell wall biosynthesis